MLYSSLESALSVQNPVFFHHSPHSHQRSGRINYTIEETH